MKNATSTHPGIILKKELDSRGFTQKDFSNEIQIAHSQFNEIVKGKRNITSDIALLLEAALGIDAIFWLNLQSAYDLSVSRVENNPVAVHLEKWRDIRPLIPYSYFKKMDILTGDIAKDEERIKEIYNIASLTDLTEIIGAEGVHKFRLTEAFTFDKVNVVGWLNLVDYKARCKNVPSFDKNTQNELISKLREVFFEKNVINKTEELLNEAGIKFVVQEKPEKAPIDGVAFWSENNPVVGITRRHDRLDNFAFTLFHELGHVFLHTDEIQQEGLAIDRIDNLDNFSQNLKIQQEVEANDFASNELIPKEEWESFNREHYGFTDRSISKFADKVGIHPAIVVGRLRFENPILYRRRFRISNEIL